MGEKDFAERKTKADLGSEAEEGIEISDMEAKRQTWITFPGCIRTFQQIKFDKSSGQINPCNFLPAFHIKISMVEGEEAEEDEILLQSSEPGPLDEKAMDVEDVLNIISQSIFRQGYS